MATEAVVPTTTETECAKCGNPCDPGASPRWCKPCRAKYQREYERTRKEMTESRGYAAGVSAMRHYLADQFSVRYGSTGYFNGYEIADIIRAARGPFDPPSVPVNGQPS